MDNNGSNLVQNDLFVNNLSSTLSVKRDYQLNEYDYEWLFIIEDTIPYIDNILLNPKKFIINEEEIVKVELAKKITVESVIHLTQHTNLIQEIDDDGDVKPSKILNINKDDSLDTYENRFIFTLINNLDFFFNQRISSCGDNSFYIDKKKFNYEGKSKVGSEDVEISLSITALDSCVNHEKSLKNLPERIKKIKTQLDGFRSSELYRTLNKLHVPIVRSPIRKTNVILKNPNFQKAEALWNYIQKFESKDQCIVDKKDYFDDSALKEQYDQAFLMQYIANQSICIEDGGLSERKIINEMLTRVIENILESEVEVDEDKLMDLFRKQLSIVKTKNAERKSNIEKILADRFNKESKKRENVLKLFSMEGI